MRTLKKIQGLGGHQLEIVAKYRKVVTRKHQMILKLMEDQLHIKWDTDHQIVYADAGKEEYLYVVCST
jgi:hypothetical protein